MHETQGRDPQLRVPAPYSNHTRCSPDRYTSPVSGPSPQKSAFPNFSM